MSQKSKEERKFKPYRVYLDSQFGKIPIIIDDIDLMGKEEGTGNVKLSVKYFLDYANKEFPKEIKKLDPEASKELMTVIRIAIHDAVSKMFEEEVKNADV